jgi:hypothetical protein
MAKQNKKTKVQTGGKKRKDRGLVVRVGPAHPRPRLQPHPRPRPRTTVVCNIM